MTRPIDVKAGQTMAVPLDELKLGPGHHSLTLSLDVRDSWVGNNRRLATFQVREPKKVLVVSDRPETRYELQGALHANRFDVETKKPAVVEGSDLSKYDAVYLFGVAKPSEALWRTLDGYVKAGGGLGVIPGDQSMDPAAYASPLLPGRYGKVEYVGDRKDVGATWSFEPETIFRHPILKPFDRWRLQESNGLLSSPPMAWAIWRVTPAAGAIVSYANAKDAPALLEKSVGAGKVLQFTTTLDLQADRAKRWNNYQEKWFYVALVGLTAKHLVGESAASACNFTTPGPEPTVESRGWGGKKVLLTGPGKLEPISVPPDTARLAIPQATIPGNYRILDADGKTPLAAFSVNLSSDEVAPVRLAPTVIEDIFGDSAIAAGSRGENLESLLKGHRQEKVELYPYFMIGILLLLALENLLANRFYRRSAQEAA
jgi:hypothetical protein